MKCIVEFCTFLLFSINSINGAVIQKLNGSGTPIDPNKILETAYNPVYPFVYDVPPLVSFAMSLNESTRKNFSNNNPYADEVKIKIGHQEYYKIKYCGVHFINKGEGYFLSDKAFRNFENGEAVRCVWGFIGNQFCTPRMECSKFQERPNAKCRTNYLQTTDAGESFRMHFCNKTTSPNDLVFTAKNGVLDVIYRFTDVRVRPIFECSVTCVNYEVNFTTSGTSAGNSTIKVEIIPDETPVVDTIPEPKKLEGCKCGIANDQPTNRTTRIVGGRETLVNKYPWTVGILSRTGVLPYCGASLISDRYVLTATHCVEDEELEDIVVVLNEHDFFNKTETAMKTIRRGVVEVITFPYYMESTFYGDIALLHLERPVDIKNYALTPICLPTDMMDLYTGKEVTAAGWGTQKGGPGGKKSNKLLEVPLVIFSNEACNDYHSHTPPEPPQVTDNMLCAGFSEGSRDTCSGDSGGPLIARREKSKRYAQVGVTSWGVSCGLKSTPGVFSRVSGTKSNTKS